MFDKNCSKDNALKGVNCNVTECAYHDGARSCTASCISVECKESESGKKSCCSTFQKK